MARPVTITLSSFRPSTPSLVAPLRLAIALASAYRRHTVTVLISDEGLLHALKDRNLSWVERYLTSAKAHQVELWVDQASLEQQGVARDDVHPMVEVKENDEFWEMRSSSALNLLF